MSSKLKNQKAFTLIELLVVMAIIAILSAIMFGPIQTARRRAKDTKLVSDIRLLNNYIQLFYQDYGYYPCINKECTGPGSDIEKLSMYGKLPIKINLTSSDTLESDLINYVPIINYISRKQIGYHLWVHLHDMNEALNNDADCNSETPEGDWSPDGCWNDESGYALYPYMSIGVSGTDSTKDGKGNFPPSIKICAESFAYCVLDYYEGSN